MTPCRSPTRRRFASASHLCPTKTRQGDLFVGLRPRHIAQRARQPLEHLCEVETFQLDGRPTRAANLRQGLRISALDPDSKEEEGLARVTVAVMHARRCLLPWVGWPAISNEPHPGTVVADPGLLVLRLARLEHVETRHDRLAHGRIATGLEQRRIELVGGVKIVDLDGTEGHRANLDPLHLDRIGPQALHERMDSSVELGDTIATHRRGCIEQQQTRAATFWIGRKVRGAEWDLIHEPSVG